MGIGLWLRDRFGLVKDKDSGDYKIDVCGTSHNSVSLYYRALAFATCTQLIGNILAKCEFEFYREGEKDKSFDDYYYFNVKPNINQNSSEFLHELVDKLYLNNEALVVQAPTGYHIADSYDLKKYEFKPSIFRRVTFGDFTQDRIYNRAEVLYFRLSNQNIRSLLDDMYSEYGQLISIAMATYKRNRGRKGILNIDGNVVGDAKRQEATAQLLMARFKTMFEAENAVVPLERGYTWQDLSEAVKDVESSRDIRSLVNDIYDLTCAAFGVSGALIRGDVAGLDEAVDFTMSFCIAPLVDLIETEINAQLFSKTDFFNGTKLVIDMSRVKYITMQEISAAVYNLINTGVYSVNEFREKLREPRLEEEWADKHFLNLATTTADKAVDVDGQTDT